MIVMGDVMLEQLILNREVHKLGAFRFILSPAALPRYRPAPVGDGRGDQRQGCRPPGPEPGL